MQAVLTANEVEELQAETSRLMAAGKPGDPANDAAAKRAYVSFVTSTMPCCGYWSFDWVK